MILKRRLSQLPDTLFAEDPKIPSPKKIEEGIGPLLSKQRTKTEN